MESDSEKKVEWVPVDTNDPLFVYKLRRGPEGKPVENIPTFAVQCMKCAKMHPFADILKGCENCSSTNYAYGGSPSQLTAVFARIRIGRLRKPMDIGRKFKTDFSFERKPL